MNILKHKYHLHKCVMVTTINVPSVVTHFRFFIVYLEINTDVT